MSLDGKIAVVTGAARGLGRAYAVRLAQLGASVAAIDRDPDGAAIFDETQGPDDAAVADRIVDFKANLAQRSTVDAVIAAVLKKFGQIDILVNNAGGAITPIDRSSASIMPEEDIRAIFDANLMSTIFCCQAVAIGMKERRAGIIVNTSSVAGRQVSPGGVLAHYSIAKAAVTHFTRNLASELGPYGIRVNCIAPGTILTGRIKALAKVRGIGDPSEAERIPLRRLGEPEDCAGVIEFLTTDLSRYVTGQCISICGGSELSPA